MREKRERERERKKFCMGVSERDKKKATKHGEQQQPSSTSMSLRVPVTGQSGAASTVHRIVSSITCSSRWVRLRPFSSGTSPSSLGLSFCARNKGFITSGLRNISSPFIFLGKSQ